LLLIYCCFTTALLQELKSKLAKLEATLRELKEKEEKESKRANGGGGGQDSAAASASDEVKAGAGLLVYETLSY
jgi:hypothetical protein